MLSEISQTEKNRYYMLPLLSEILKKKKKKSKSQKQIAEKWLPGAGWGK